MIPELVTQQLARILQDNLNNRLTMAQINGILYDFDMWLRQTVTQDEPAPAKSDSGN